MMTTETCRRWRQLSIITLFFIFFGSSAHAATMPNQPVGQKPPRQLAIVAPIIDCAELASVDLSAIGGAGSKVTSAKEVVKDANFCEVEGVLKPAITFKVLLPTDSWQQRFLQVGCGGLCGRIQLQLDGAAGCFPLDSNGFVIAATDMGHALGDINFGNDPQKRRDFAYRAVHLTAVATKQLIQTFYGRKAAYAYFSGCSDGGREGLMEAQRYPADFNGIVAGAAANNFQVQKAVYHSWQAQSNTDANGKAVITAAQLPLIHNAVLAQCDAQDGQVDGLIADPQSCHFNPAVLSCARLAPGSANGHNCLSDTQLATLHRLYDGPRDPKSLERLTVGGPLPGSELAWAGIFVPKKTGDLNYSESVALSTLKYLNYEKNPPASFSLKEVKQTAQMLADLSKLHPLYDATNPNLQPFYAAGGKLILWHGWGDPSVSPLNTLAYHQALGETLGLVTRDKFERLYMLPGLYHCSTGEGPSMVDFLTPMLNWVEQGIAPDSVLTYMVASEQKNKMITKKPQGDMKLETIADNAASRPVYPYPDYAVYSGKGDVSQAANYQRKKLATVPENYHWLGEGFYKPYAALN